MSNKQPKTEILVNLPVRSYKGLRGFWDSVQSAFGKEFALFCPNCNIPMKAIYVPYRPVQDKPFDNTTMIRKSLLSGSSVYSIARVWQKCDVCGEVQEIEFVA